MKLTIRKKLLLCAFLPIGILGIIIIIMAATSLRSSIIRQVENSLRGTAAATLAAYDQNSGLYLVAENGDIWKGGYNISRSEKLLDTIREKSGMEVTFFYGDKRIMTSIVDADGKRILGSPAGEKIVEEVLKKGQEYFSRQVSVDGKMYYGYYVPVFQDGDAGTPVGMVFAGVDRSATLNSVMRIVFFMVVTVVLIALAGMLVTGLVSNSISKALKEEVVCVEGLATGNLNVQLNRKHLLRGDEVGELTRSIDKLQTDLRGIIGGIGDSTAQLIAASDMLGQTSKQTLANMDDVMQSVGTITSGAVSQAEDTQNASDTIARMGELIIETGSQAGQLSKSADIMLASSDETGETIDGLKNISEEVKNVVDMIAELTSQTNESAKTIREAAGLISDIAGQTTLLSLNANIEAARAGEAGRGFAVVADAIQKLAEQSNDTSSSIDHIVNTLLVNAEHVVEAMQHMQEVTGRQNEYIVSTEQSVRAVIDEIHVSIQNIRNIEDRTRKLEDARKDMMSVITGLSDIAESNVVNTKETGEVIANVSECFREVEKSALNLKETADGLEQNICNFRME